MKNIMDGKNPKLKRSVKKIDIHGCVFCPYMKSIGYKTLRFCELSNNKELGYLAVQKHVIPEWCKLADY